MASSADKVEVESCAKDQALAWFARMQSDEATPQDRRRFEAWLAADAENAREFDRLKSLWHDLDKLLEEKRAEWRNFYHGARQKRNLSRRQLLIGGATAGIVAVGALAVFRLTDLGDLWSSDFHTGTGELKTVRLADGSVVTLDADTAVAIDYTALARRVRLLYGRADFAVAKDTGRPLEVACVNGTTRALGTEFVVHRCFDRVIVTVTDSTVEVVVRAAETDQPHRIRTVAGETISYSRGGLEPAKKTDDAAETGWRRGKLIFSSQRLADVVEDLNRYRPGRIVLLDNSLGDLQVDGVFDTSNPDAALDAIMRTLPVRSLYLTRYLVLLRHA